MKKSIIYSVLFLLFLSSHANAQNQKNPWQKTDLEAPAKLAAQIKSGDAPLIISVGPAALIKGSVDIGPASEAESLEKLKALLKKQPKDKPIVIYCGCCPFDHCPNVRPAFNLVKKMKLSNAKLLNLSNNIRTDWMDKGYPTASE